MATFSTDRMNLLEAYRRLGYENPELLLGEMLDQNDFLRVATVAPANKGFFNETLRAIKLGEGKITGINAGIPNVTSATDKVSDPVVLYEGASYVDERIFDGVTDVAAVRNSNEQIVLVSNEVPLMQFGNINLGRFKAGAVPETNNIYSWVMTNYWVTNFNADQHGEFEWTYSLTSSDDPSDAFATRYAWNERIPVLARVIPAGKDTGNRKMDEPALKIDNENLLLVNMCPVKGENALMLHLREIAGKSAEFKVSSPFSDNLKCTECDAIGDPIEGGSLEFNPYEIKFIKIEL